ncbi:hypothetical protein MNV49_004954 [Pseudohyphozyma bogoriensis]|nr:hypothetical protein MNV49_004954 [Pseudohyphozyma bogoriensis]
MAEQPVVQVDDSGTSAARSGAIGQEDRRFSVSDRVAAAAAVNSTGSVHKASWSYLGILWLFRLVLKVFYSNVVVEGSENITRDGVPCVICSNHTNSLTDALLLVTTVPRSKRKLLRLTAKDTQFGRGTFTSWLIESAGTLPIKRPKDHLGQKVDNSVVFEKLIDALEDGDAICMFPEGLSRYYPELAPLRQGVSRIVSDTLSRQKDNPQFEIAIQTCSITYLHRNLFRSDVLVTFHPPIVVSVASHPGLIGTPTTAADYEAVRALTASMGEQIRSGTLDAPSWTYIRLAHTARRLYAPLGTKLSLGDHVRLTQRFVDAFAGKRAARAWTEGVDPKTALKTPMVEKGKENGDYFDSDESAASQDEVATGPHSAEELEQLAKDLKTYQVAQTKLVYGLITGVSVYALCVTFTLPFAIITVPGIPVLMWVTLRWLEDFTSSLRAALALFRLLMIGKGQLLLLREMREELRGRVVDVAVRDCGLPADSDKYLAARPKWRGLHAGFFSLRRRRKKDWNEVLKLWDISEYPEDDLNVPGATGSVPQSAPEPTATEN